MRPGSKSRSPISPPAPRARKRRGYDGVEVMGSEGYFLNQFLVTHTNKRTDRWGGSYENRMRLPIEVVKRVRAAVGSDFIIIYRLSMIDLVPNGSTHDEVVQLAREIEKAGAASSIPALAGMRRAFPRLPHRCRAGRFPG